jgi:hypothetical protein
MSCVESGCRFSLFFWLPTVRISHNSLPRSVNTALTASHPEAVDLYSGCMFKPDLLKFDPLAYVLITVVIVLQIYSTFLRSSHTDTEVDRGLLKATLAACSR